MTTKAMTTKAMTTKARLLLAEDHKEMREMIVSILEREFVVVGAVGDGQALLEEERRSKPDVCVIDISMPVLNGIEAANLLQQKGSMAKIVFVTMHGQSAYLEAALEAGALGYVLKPRMGSDLVPAIREAMSDRLFISPSLLPQSASTNREN
jgi:DNA-binding NarL/FixJ family response regulator